MTVDILRLRFVGVDFVEELKEKEREFIKVANGFRSIKFW